MTDTTSNIPIEPPVRRIPFFNSNASVFGCKLPFSTLTLPSQLSSPYPQLIPRHISSQTNLPSCTCPHILVADDDPFEAFYYQHLFQKSLAFDRFKLRVHTYSSGEDLITCYKRYELCGCGSISLIITDYNMGPLKLNGVSTVTLLRELGYKGHLVLRTSEMMEKLIKEHLTLEAFFRVEKITYLNKADYKKTKEVLQELIETGL